MFVVCMLFVLKICISDSIYIISSGNMLSARSLLPHGSMRLNRRDRLTISIEVYKDMHSIIYALAGAVQLTENFMFYWSYHMSVHLL